jgi:hypothetical protein
MPYLLRNLEMVKVSCILGRKNTITQLLSFTKKPTLNTIADFSQKKKENTIADSNTQKCVVLIGCSRMCALLVVAAANHTRGELHYIYMEQGRATRSEMDVRDRAKT